MKYIGIGKCNKYNIYILTAFLSDILIDALFGLNSSNKDKPVRIFSFRAKIKNHKLLYDFIRFAAIFFGGLVLYFFEGRDNSKEKGEVTIEEYEKMKTELFYFKNVSIKYHNIFLGIVFSLLVFLQDLISVSGIDMSLWTNELLYIAIISYWIFKNKIYIHKKIAIGIMLVLTIIDVIEFFFPDTKHENLEGKNELTDKNVFEMCLIKYGAYIIPLLFIAGELKHILRDYCWIKAKYLMDIKSIPPYKIFFSIGSVGIIFIIFLFSIFTFVPCKTFNNIDKIKDNYFYKNTSEPIKLYKEYCQLKDYDEKTKTLYLFYDSMKLISREYSNTDKENMLEIFLVIPLLFLFLSIYEVSCLIVLRYNEPFSVLIYRFFYYSLTRLIKFIVNKGDEQYLRHDKFILLEFEQIIAIISGLIYIEVIELKFCGLDYELKKNIDKRGSQDIIKVFSLKDIDSDNEFVELQENNNYI